MIATQEIRDTMHDILVDLQDEKIPYEIRVYNDNRPGWAGWETPIVKLLINRDHQKYNTVISSITHLSLYLKDMGYEGGVTWERVHEPGGGGKYFKRWEGKTRKTKQK